MVSIEAGNDVARAKFHVLLTATLISSLISLDANIIAVSLPAIARTLGASFADIEWAVSAFILSFAALLMAAGSFADRHGRKLVMLIGLVLFAAASGVCGLATSSLMLNLARAVQGVGGALLLTASVAVLFHTFTGTERARAYAFWGAAIGIAMTVGPIVGGVITHFFGWRWIFLVNVPICVALFFVAIAVIDESRDPEAKRLDLPGILSFSLGLFLLIWALIAGNGAGWTTTPILLRFAGAGFFFIVFAIVEIFQDRPMVDFALFTRPTFLGSAFAMVGYAAGAQVMIYYLPLFLQNAYGFGPAAAGLAMIPFALPMVLVPRFSAKLANVLSGRLILVVGLAVTAAGNLLLWAIARDGQPYPMLVIGMVVAGIGAGVLNGETVKVMQGAVPPQRAGMASGLAGTARFAGLLLGIAGLGAVLSQVAHTSFLALARALGLDPAIAAAAVKHVASGDGAGLLSAVPTPLQSQIHHLASLAFADGFAAASLLAAIIAAVAGLLTLALVRAADTAPAKQRPTEAILAMD